MSILKMFGLFAMNATELCIAVTMEASAKKRQRNLLNTVAVHRLKCFLLKMNVKLFVNSHGEDLER